MVRAAPHFGGSGHVWYGMERSLYCASHGPQGWKEVGRRGGLVRRSFGDLKGAFGVRRMVIVLPLRIHHIGLKRLDASNDT